MTSEWGLPARCGISFGTAVSVATWCAIGSIAAGSRFTSAAVVPGVAALAAVADAPATATPARNLRRLTSGREFFRAIFKPPQNVIAALADRADDQLRIDLIIPAVSGRGKALSSAPMSRRRQSTQI